MILGAESGFRSSYAFNSWVVLFSWLGVMVTMVCQPKRTTPADYHSGVGGGGEGWGGWGAGARPNVRTDPHIRRAALGFRI